MNYEEYIRSIYYDKQEDLPMRECKYILLSHGFATLWTVCSNLETLILGRDDIPKSFHENLIEAFRVLRYSKKTCK